MTELVPRDEPKKMGRPIKWTKEIVDDLADKLLDYAENSPLPLLCKFGYDNNVNPKLFTQNKNFYLNDNFCEALNKAKLALEYKLVVGGISGKFNCSMVIFALKNVAGWRDATSLEHVGKDGEPLSFGEPTKIEFIGVMAGGSTGATTARREG